MKLFIKNPKTPVLKKNLILTICFESPFFFQEIEFLMKNSRARQNSSKNDQNSRYKSHYWIELASNASGSKKKSFAEIEKNRFGWIFFPRKNAVENSHRKTTEETFFCLFFFLSLVVYIYFATHFMPTSITQCIFILKYNILRFSGFSWRICCLLLVFLLLFVTFYLHMMKLLYFNENFICFICHFNEFFFCAVCCSCCFLKCKYRRKSLCFFWRKNKINKWNL